MKNLYGDQQEMLIDTEPSSQVSSLDLDLLERNERQIVVFGGRQEQEGLIAAQAIATRLQTALSTRASLMQHNDNDDEGATELRSTTYKSVKGLIDGMLKDDKEHSEKTKIILEAEAKQRHHSAFIANNLQAKVTEASELYQKHMRRLNGLYEQREANRKRYLAALDESQAKHATRVVAHKEAVQKARKKLEKNLTDLQKEHSNLGTLKRHIINNA